MGGRAVRALLPGLAWAAVLGGLYLTSQYSDLLFHSLSESFAIVVACGIFMVAWNARPYLDDHLLLWLGIASLFVAGLDLLHLLSYDDVGVFPGTTANVSTQLWVAARAMQAGALVAAPGYLTRRLDARVVFLGAGTLSALIVLAVFQWRLLPDAFVAAGGLTRVTQAIELGICGLLGLAIWLLAAKRHLLHPDVYRLLVASIAVTIGSELCFGLDYTPVTRAANLAGHLLRIVAFYLLYKATIETAFVKPYALLFRSLRQSEEELRRALGEVKQLSGMLPICSSCKQIRNDQGYWQEVEVYLSEHSEAEFSHGLCPECAHRLYPEYFPAPPRK